MGRDSGVFQDPQDQIAESLKNIEAILAQEYGNPAQQTVEGDDIDYTQEFGTVRPDSSDGTGGSAPSGTKVMPPSKYIITETDDLDAANADGTITLQPGEEKTIVEFDPGYAFALLAAGASDTNDAVYYLYADGSRPIGGVTNSPLGPINNPFSFQDALGRGVYLDRRVEYRVRLSQNATSAQDLAGRLHSVVLQ
jgi:hypothetical protein